MHICEPGLVYHILQQIYIPFFKNKHNECKKRAGLNPALHNYSCSSVDSNTSSFTALMPAVTFTSSAEVVCSWQYSDLTSRGYYPIYPSFTNTMNLLRECQLDVDSWNSYDEIKEISFDLSQLSKYDKEPYESSSSQYYTVSDPQLIAQIMSQAAIDEYAGMNPFGIWNTDRISFSAVSSALGNRSEIQYIVPLKLLPDSVREALKP